MNTGDALKYFREGMNINQKEFVGNLFSTSYYSKVENNDSDLTTSKLIELLRKNNIDPKEFFYMIRDGKDEPFIEWYHKIRDAYYTEDKSLLGVVMKEIPENDYFFKVAKLLKENIPNNEDKKLVINYLSNINRWSEYHILLFLLGTKIFSIKELLFLFGTFSKNISDTTIYKMYEKDIILALLNIVEACLRNKKIDEANYFIQVIPILMTNPFYLFERTMLEFYSHFILLIKNSEKEKNMIACTEILEQFKKYKMYVVENLIVNLMELYEIDEITIK